MCCFCCFMHEKHNSELSLSIVPYCGVVNITEGETITLFHHIFKWPAQASDWCHNAADTGNTRLASEKYSPLFYHWCSAFYMYITANMFGNCFYNNELAGITSIRGTLFNCCIEVLLLEPIAWLVAVVVGS